ncbi:MAG: hypothetical protein ACJ8C4_15335 [Gemmataceae bacterium]
MDSATRSNPVTFRKLRTFRRAYGTKAVLFLGFLWWVIAPRVYHGITSPIPYGADQNVKEVGRHDDSQGLILLRCAGVGIVGFLAWGAYNLGQTRGQRRRDAFAANLLGTLHSGGKPPPFSLYLRSFSTTGKMPVEAAEFTNHSFASALQYKDLETILAEAIEPHAPLIALGTPGEHFGAGRILTDDAHWAELVYLLANAAETIYLVPSSRKGVVWEVQWLVKDGLIEKTIFLNPPKTEWVPIQTAIARAGVRVPPEQAVVYRVDSNGKPIHCESLLTEPRALRDQLARVSSKPSTTPRPGNQPLRVGAETPLKVSKQCPICGSAESTKHSRMLGQLGKIEQITNICSKCGAVYTNPTDPKWYEPYVLMAITVILGWITWMAWHYSEVAAQPWTDRIFPAAIFGLLTLGAGVLSICMLPSKRKTHD